MCSCRAPCHRGKFPNSTNPIKIDLICCKSYKLLKSRTNLKLRFTKIVQSFSKLRLNLRKICQSWKNLHKLSECSPKCITVVESNTKLNKPSSLGSFHNFGATWGNFCQFWRLLTFSPVTWGLMYTASVVYWVMSRCDNERDQVRDSVLSLKGWQTQSHLYIDLLKQDTGLEEPDIKTAMLDRSVWRAITFPVWAKVST